MKNRKQKNGSDSFDLEDISATPWASESSESSKGPLTPDELANVF